ncbi:DNA methyltransferase [Novosphingobium sp. UBA1939]|uniref:DNA methyltransferase n=1 Tax=Novosphingobium sp. UBA1939 TaxID=1946982 RepID=UPI0025D6A84F|nr:DNA methyltransferase [Novosphingobium sp. UBA1939]
MTRTVIIGPEHAPVATLILGDAYQVTPTLGWFDALCMDPPYKFNNEGGGHWREERGAAEQMMEEGLTEGFDHTIINSLLCGSVVVFCHNDQLADLLPYLRGNFHRHVVCMWIKSNPAPHRNKHYLADTEPYVHAWNRSFHPVGEHHDMHRFVLATSMPRKVFGHATVKPLSVMDKIMRNLAGQTVLDPFMGTGSTGISAIRAGKRFTGIEHNPVHFETACARIRDAWAQLEAASKEKVA